MINDQFSWDRDRCSASEGSFISITSSFWNNARLRDSRRQPMRVWPVETTWRAPRGSDWRWPPECQLHARIRRTERDQRLILWQGVVNTRDALLLLYDSDVRLKTASATGSAVMNSNVSLVFLLGVVMLSLYSNSY
jgi:hypothetical protein